MLKDKVALVFGATGAIGTAVAQRWASEGARLYVSGRDLARAEAVARSVGGHAARVDTQIDADVARYVDQVAEDAGRIDIVLNAVGPRAADAGYGTRSTELSADRFAATLNLIAGSQFLTARHAARHMTAQRNGSIIFLSASLSGLFVPLMAGVTAACGAVEAMSRSLAAEFGPLGIRVNCLRAGGMPETRTIQETSALIAGTMGARVADAQRAAVSTVLARPVRLQEVATVAAFLASDAAAGIAGQIVNVCAGAIVSR